MKVEYLNFDYAIINPKNLIGIDEFNQTFFDKIDQIEIYISNNVDFEIFINSLNLKKISVSNFRFSSDKNDIEKKIFESKNIDFDLFENNDDYIIYKINSSEKKSPDLKDEQIKKEILQLISQKNKFEYNKDLIDKIQKNEFSERDFVNLGGNNIQEITINSSKDNKKFEINSIELLYSLPINSFTLINDDKNNIYLVKIKQIKTVNLDLNDKNFKQYINKQNSKNKNTILKSYDLLLNNKYNVVLNHQTIERVKNFFK